MQFPCLNCSDSSFSLLLLVQESFIYTINSKKEARKEGRKGKEMQVNVVCERRFELNHGWSSFKRHIPPPTKIMISPKRWNRFSGIISDFHHQPRSAICFCQRSSTNRQLRELCSNNMQFKRKMCDMIQVDGSDCKPEPGDFIQKLTQQTTGFCLVFGLIMLYGSQAAAAVLESESSGQLIDYTGGFGDISTGFASAFLLIFFSELGDKTFFIAALLAAQNSGAVVFIGTFGALTVMTIISVILGRIFHYVDGILPFRICRLGGTDLPIDDIAAACLLVWFGVSTLLEAASDDGSKSKDEEEEAKLAISGFSGNDAGIVATAGTVLSTFVLVFIAEWGDKSFFSTIALAAASSPIGVIGGALGGHAAATAIAVLGGSLLGSLLSEKVVAYIGGTLFLVFAVMTTIEIFN